MARSGGASATALIWLTVVLKVVGVLLALALVRPETLPLPSRWLQRVAGAVAVLLTLYGGILMLGEALVEAGALHPKSVDWTALRWHLGLWDLWFLVWGLLLGLATWGFRRAGPLH
jgi:hypothetical protein